MMLSSRPLAACFVLLAGSQVACNAPDRVSAAENDVQSDRPNIILVMADDQGWGDVAYNGHPFVQTPALDQMAKDGLTLDRFYAAAPVCSPTRASVLTGRHPIRTKVTNHGRYMRPQEQTIAETLRDAGYVTGLFGKFHLGSGQPGTDCNPGGMGFDEWVVGLNFFDEDPFLSRNGTVEHRSGLGSVLTMDDALSFLEKHKDEGRPIFTVIWFPSPHDPHAEGLPTLPLYADEENAGYYREISLLDSQVGRLRNNLRTMGIEDNTIVWYCSDNGGLVAESSGGRGRKGSIYEGGLRVPSVIEWPARGLRGSSEVPMSTSDMYPTLVSLAGVDLVAPHPLDGVDVSRVLSGEALRRGRPMGFWHQIQAGQGTWSDAILEKIMKAQVAGAKGPHNAQRLRKDVDSFPQFDGGLTKGHAAWTDWPWKLHRIQGDRFELYQLLDDPKEEQDLSGKPRHAERLERMKGELDAWMRSVIGSLNGNDYRSQ